MILSRSLPLIAAVILLSTPAMAQTTPFEMPQAEPAPEAPEAGEDDSITSLFENFFREAAPHIEGLFGALEGTAQELAPALSEVGDLIDDIGNYQRPERLPNGDIVIRRRPDAPPPPPTAEIERLVPDAPPDTPRTAPRVPEIPPGPEIAL
ncbi:hypothetical protein KTN05_10825 [Paracoccus sp. Z118]|uniref:hypothetical protein n=1 Tax=Paracoccus sp. Z118 TaxID=2851017 RepID=UPI001C2C7DB0|nr:hypothetical protein [Paracoccus sp. Z118]MBV0892344.1 hypothetical protein [Paracoccus sp. Z118]